MLFEGHFTNIKGNDVSVKIITDGSTSDKLHIAAASVSLSGASFATGR